MLQENCTGLWLIASIAALCLCLVGGPSTEEPGKGGVLTAEVTRRWDGLPASGVSICINDLATSHGSQLYMGGIPTGYYTIIVAGAAYDTVTLDSVHVVEGQRTFIPIQIRLNRSYIRHDPALSAAYDSGVAMAAHNFAQGNIYLRGRLNLPHIGEADLLVDTIDTWLPMSGETSPLDGNDSTLASFTGYNDYMIEQHRKRELASYDLSPYRDFIVQDVRWQHPNNSYFCVLTESSAPLHSPDSNWTLTVENAQIRVTTQDTSYVVPDAFVRLDKYEAYPDQTNTAWMWGPSGSNLALWLSASSAVLNGEYGFLLDLWTGRVLKKWSPSSRVGTLNRR